MLLSHAKPNSPKLVPVAYRRFDDRWLRVESGLKEIGILFCERRLDLGKYISASCLTHFAHVWLSFGLLKVKAKLHVGYQTYGPVWLDRPTSPVSNVRVSQSS